MLERRRRRSERKVFSLLFSSLIGAGSVLKRGRYSRRTPRPFGLVDAAAVVAVAVQD